MSTAEKLTKILQIEAAKEFHELIDGVVEYLDEQEKNTNNEKDNPC